ncbi:hypothetical protein BAUCODRAFT_508360 [Baudoinia panamericana UAMH 10762]|uniref:ML-like domain-containing protein n=1 Tax=Baudoinia panamericana (strain UAMH 10762) TaxID=717646 RepID=M2LNH7_BAUPA|nr:uncharacterized protein BAUCODRAFT_508360 [Baudoinia panamericana UAMH 10762]EMC95907.1 hypothetical protein BAUCODRAFT_508360 [Baudoinia panamericana UAMH 10762]
MAFSRGTARFLSFLLLGLLPVSVLGGNILSTSGFTICQNNATVQVTKLNVTYNKDTRIVNFDVAGSSNTVQNVTATMIVSAYGQQVYTNTFNPCDTGMAEMCPVPAASFASHGQQTIPQEYADKIPSIAFSIPNLDSTVKMTLQGDGGEDVACIESMVGNGQTLHIAAISYAAVGMAAAALVLSALSALAAGGHPGASTPSPTFGEVIGWFQSMATNGMLSVPYPSVYRSFTANFAFSTGLVPWGSMQVAIDNFRAKTGGNLTEDSYQYLDNNATLVFQNGATTSARMARRAVSSIMLWARDGSTVTVNGTSTDVGGSGESSSSPSLYSKADHFVSGIEAYSEQLEIPEANTFMTLLLIWAIIVAVIIVFILLLKAILEAWSMFGNIPRSMESWRKRYWWRLAKSLTSLILLLYGVWTLYCIYQFTNGDSWAAKVLAGITLGLFTLVLAWYTWQIHSKAKEYKKLEGDAGKLYEEKETWIKYNIFYENYKKRYWWLFVPVIVYGFAKGCIIAGANGHGLIQSAGQLIVESLMLGLLLWTRPFQMMSGQWINILVQIVRVISVGCILVFVEELGISQTTKTITGIVLVVTQCVLTALLAILLVVNALVNCIRENPHRRARKEREKLKLERDLDNLTPLEPMQNKGSTAYKAPMVAGAPFGDNKGRYGPVPARAQSPAPSSELDLGRPSRFAREGDDTRLMSSAASMGRRTERSVSRSPDREPTLPDVGLGRGY